MDNLLTLTLIVNMFLTALNFKMYTEYFKDKAISKRKETPTQEDR